MKNMKTTLAAGIVATMLFTSCSVTRTYVGNAPVGTDKTGKLFASAKRFYLFAGIIPLGDASVKTPANDFVIKTSLRSIGVLSWQKIEVFTK
ncbi:MAG TPA: hypothetical protein VF411_02725 [Bacteroidia bacterium]